jgi:hypothetical protein
LVKQGVITAETYLWCEGMPDWEKYGDFFQTSQKRLMEVTRRLSIVRRSLEFLTSKEILRNHLVLIHFKEQIDRNAGLTLALETINGMAKTIPMKNEAVENPSAEMLVAQHQALKIGHG